MKSIFHLTKEELSKFRIDHGIVIDPYLKANNSKYGVLLRKMKPGDSVHFQDRDQARSAWRWFYHQDIPATYRKEVDIEKYGEGYRLFRLK